MTKEEKKEYDKKNYQKNKEIIKKRSKKYYNANNEAIKKTGKKYRESNRESKNKYLKEWRQKNSEEIKKYRRKKYKQTRKNNPLFKLKENIKRLIRQSFKAKNHTKKTNSSKIIGCSFEQFKIHIEQQFDSWMNWNNYGVYKINSNRTWQIDHIVPLATAKTEEDIIKLNHYMNLRPLCSKENLDKRDKI
jgi:hypothetical protein